MENQNITHLLSHISVICRKYEAIAEITGENFNVFKVLGLTTNEVRTHSAFLAELLNPKGSHGCKDAFLKLFVEEFNIKEFNTENAITQVEKHIGFINDDYTEGGYIDIIITNKDNHAIIIENKIYAGDQEKQLLRYHNFGNNFHGEKFNLLYLTLNGTEPAISSIHTLEKETHFHCISYKNDILNWLEKCQKEAFAKPLLRETITQYINLIKHLTNQTINNKMENEIINTILKSSDNIESAFVINKNINELQKIIINNYRKTLTIELAKQNFKHIDNEKFGEYDQNITFFKENWSNEIVLSFNKPFGDLMLGILPKENIDKELQTKVREKLVNYPIGKSLNWDNWIWISFYESFNEMSWSDIYKGNLTDDTIKKIAEIEIILKDLNL